MPKGSLASRRDFIPRRLRPGALALAAAAVLSLGASVRAGFTEVTSAVGIDEYERVTRRFADFVVRGGSPIVMDFDGNGWLDLYIVRYQLEDILYLNEGGAFTKVVDPLGIGASGGNVAAWADLDNDGRKEFIVAVADETSHRLYQNLGNGVYEEQGAQRGIAMPSIADHQGTAVTVGDINRDGYLDLIIGEWGVDVDETTRFQHYGLFLNKGPENPGYFTNVTQSAGFDLPHINFFSPAITDLDQDGWPDIAATIDFGRSVLFWNNADGTFSNGTQSSGVGLENHGMGIAIGDVNNNGLLDWWVTTIAITRDPAGEVNPLYVNQGRRLFANKSVEAGTAFGGWGWGTNLFDYDHDGDLDIVMVNQEDLTPEGSVNDGRMFLWRNDGKLDFTDVSDTEGANLLSRGAGLVTFDYDNDGDLDIFFVNQHSGPTLLRNNNPTEKAWLQLTLEGAVSNRDGIGALVTVHRAPNSPGRIQEFNPTNTYLAQLSQRIHFGLGNHEGPIHKVTVRWPSSIVQELTDVAPNQILHIVEDESLLEGSEVPVFSQSPTNQVGARGQPLTLSVAIEGGFRPAITWYRNGALLAGFEGPEITLDNLQPRHAGTYHARAANSAGSARTPDFIVGVRSDFSSRNIARQWNEAVLDAARINFPDPPIVARTFYHASAAMWDAFWAYQPEGWGHAQPAFHREELGPDDWQGDREAAQRQALSHAVFTVAAERYRKAFNHDAILLALRDLMLELGYDPDDTSVDGNAPAAVGNRIGQAILQAGLADGSNEANGYADTTGYAPVNEPLVYGSSGATLVDPNRWQPLNLTRSVTKNGIDLGAEVQQFLAPQWNWVSPFALHKPTDSTILIDPGPPPLFGTDTEAQYIAEAVEVIRASSLLDPTQEIYRDISPGAPGQNNPYLTHDGNGHPLNPVTGEAYEEYVVNQGDLFRITAEFWSDGPGIEGPPGVWNMTHNQVTDHPAFTRRLGGVGPELSPLEWDVHAYLALNGALHDAAIASWTIKAKYDSIRPVSMIRYLAGLGQSSDPDLPSYHPSGLPLEPGLIELITEESAATGKRHAHLSEHLGEIALFAWRGMPQNPDLETAGVGWIRGLDWTPYHLRTFPTPNFAGYVSGHSTFSRAGAEVMALLTGSPFFPGGLKEYDFPAGEYLNVEYGPRDDLTIPVATYYDAADLTGIARIYCGVHIAADDFVGRKVGARVGTDAVLKTLALRQGPTATQGLGNPRLQLALTPGQPAPLIAYQAPQPLPPRQAATLAAAQSGEPGVYAVPAGDEQLSFQFKGQPLVRLQAKSQLGPAQSLALDFSLDTDEPVTLLATAQLDAPEAGSQTLARPKLSLYQLSGDAITLLDANENWIEHPSASTASVFANRRDLAGEELDPNASALPILASRGQYRLLLEAIATSDTQTAALALELVANE